jgi:hypothetical protein
MSPSRSTLPVGPLLAAAMSQASRVDPLAGRAGPIGGALRAVPSHAVIGRTLGVTASAVSALRARGTVSHWTADRHAVALGMHPAEIWGDQWWNTPQQKGQR